MLKTLKNNIAETLWFLGFVVFAITLNMQLTDAANIHKTIAGHDEYLTVRQVYSILEPASWKHFVMAVISGEKLYYGRVMFYMDALFAYVPYKIWGVTGMIFAIRMAHSLVIALALWLLGRTFIDNKPLRILFLVAGSIGFYTNYFIMMPKPEPYQLLFLALFLKYWKASGWVLGKSFIWLGLAFGAKFNILFTLPVVALISFIPSLRPESTLSNTSQKWLITSVKTLGWFILGLIIAIPCLALIPIKPVILDTYIHHTFLGSGQIDDDASVNWFQWLFDSYGMYYWGHKWMSLLFLGLLSVISFLIIRLKFKRKVFTQEWVILLITACLFFPVILLTKRLWPHYLWEAHLLFLLLFFMTIQNTDLLSPKPAFFFKSCLFAGVAFFVIQFLLFYSHKYYGLDKCYNKEKVAWELARDYILEQKSNARTLQDMSVYFPYREFVKINPYHPFRGELPVNENQPTFSWAIPDDPYEFKVWESADYLILDEMNPENRTIGEANNLKRFKDHWKSEMASLIGTIWTKDTIISTYHIYKKVKDK